jgi:type IV secretory pathway VirB6-like protein
MMKGMAMVMFARDKVLWFAVLALMCLLLAPESHAAGNAVQNALAGPCTTIFQNNFNPPGPNPPPPGITTPMVACMTVIVNALMGSFIGPLINDLQSTVLGLMTMAVVVIGFRIMFGSLQRNLGRELTILLLKIAAVSALVSPAHLYTDYMNQISIATSGISSAAIGVLDLNTDVPRNYSYISPNGMLSEVGTPAAPTSTQLNINPGNTINLMVPGGSIWFFVDDLIRTVLGTNIGTALAKAAGVFALCLLLMAMGPIGFWVIMVVLGTIIMLFLSLAMAIYLYIASLLALLFLSALGPICIPLILFRSWGMPMFEAWLRQVISYTMQPMILTVFFVFMLLVLFAILTDLEALYREMFTAPQERTSLFELFQQRETVQTEPTSSEGLDNVAFESGRAVLRSDSGPGASLTGRVQSWITFPYINISFDRIKDLIITLILAFICMLVMLTFQKDLPEIVTELVGQGDRTIQNLASKANFGGHIDKAASMLTDSVGSMGMGSQDALKKLMGK